jgi:hypothetical protein
LKLSTELKILIALVAGAIVLWGVYALDDNFTKTVNDVLVNGERASVEEIDPIYTNALMNAGTYQIISKNISESDIAKTFWLTYVGKDVKSIKILNKTKLSKAQVTAAFKGYTFVNSENLDFLKKNGYVKKDISVQQLNTLLSNYNLSTIQTMLNTREGIPQFSAYELKVRLTFKDNSTKDVKVIAMRAISSATGQPYKHLRWAVSKVY